MRQEMQELRGFRRINQNTGQSHDARYQGSFNELKRLGLYLRRYEVVVVFTFLFVGVIAHHISQTGSNNIDSNVGRIFFIVFTDGLTNTEANNSTSPWANGLCL